MNEASRCSTEEYRDLLQKRQQLELQIQSRAIADPQFRQALLSDPKKALADTLGADIPDNLQIHVREETPTTAYLRIPSPPEPVTASEELSDEALESVAGGGVVLAYDSDSGGVAFVVSSRRRTTSWGFVVY